MIDPEETLAAILRSKWFRIARRFLISVALIIALLFSLFVWWSFHPSGTVPVFGPAGPKYRAFIEDRSLGDMCFVLCVSDWPYTFIEPISVGSVLYSEGSDSRVYWSVDGSVIAVRDREGYLAAYDYRSHDLIRYDAGRMRMLIESRGGLGPEHRGYSDGKESYGP